VDSAQGGLTLVARCLQSFLTDPQVGEHETVWDSWGPAGSVGPFRMPNWPGKARRPV